MVAGGVDGGRQPSAEPLHPDCDVLAVRTDHRQIEDGDLDALRVAAQRCAVAVQDVDLGLAARLGPTAGCSRRPARRRSCSVRRSPEPPTMIGTSLTGRG